MQSYYNLYKRLHETLLELDKDRERDLFFVTSMGIVCFIIFFYISGWFDLLIWGFPILDESIIFDVVFHIILILILNFFYRKLAEFMNPYRLKFKEMIIKPIISSLADDVVYQPDRAFSSLSAIEDSGFFSERPAGINGEDLVRGTIKGIEFVFSEIEAYKIVTYKNSESEKTLNEGIFFMALFPEIIAKKINISGRTRMIHPTEHTIFKHFPTKIVLIFAAISLGIFALIFGIFSMDEIITFFKNRILFLLIVGAISVYYFISATFSILISILSNLFIHEVKLKNVDFKKYFKVGSEIPTDGNLLQSKELQKALIDFQKKTATSASIHIRNERLYIFIPKSFDIFEPKWFKKNTDPKVIQESYDIVKGFYDIIVAIKEAMKLP